MRIVQTPVRFYPYIGGVESFVCELSKALVGRGHDVRVICSDEGQDGKIEDINVRALPYAFKIANTNVTLSLPFVLKRESYDIMHTHMPTPYTADISAYVSKLNDKPVVLTYHNDIVAQGINRVFSSVYNSLILPRLLDQIDAITVSTDAYRRRLEERYSQARGKTEVIPPGIDIEYFKPAIVKEHERKSIFFLSVLDEFHRYKGLDYLLEAVKDLDVELTVGGGGRLLDEYRKKAGDNVRFLGRISEEEKIRLYQSSDMFVLPSTSAEQEGFGIVALEALACGTPCIVSDIVGLSGKMRAKKCGTVVPPRDIDALRSAIDEFEPDEASRKRARDLSLEYSWSRIAERFENVYEAVL